MKRCLLIILAVLVLIPASVVSATTYLGIINIRETGGYPYAKWPFSVSIDNTNLVGLGFMRPDGRDTRIENIEGTALPHMVADNQTLFVTDITANTNTGLIYTFGNTPADFNIITGQGGYVTIADNETIELGGNYIVEIGAYFKTTPDFVGDNITSKGTAFRLYVSSPGTITISVNNGDNVTSALNIPSKYHDLIIAKDGNNLTITIDDKLEGTVGCTANVTDNGVPWILGGDATPYIRYFKIKNK